MGAWLSAWLDFDLRRAAGGAESGEGMKYSPNQRAWVAGLLSHLFLLSTPGMTAEPVSVGLRKQLLVDDWVVA